jgi:hypothetical protein
VGGLDFTNAVTVNVVTLILSFSGLVGNPKMFPKSVSGNEFLYSDYMKLFRYSFL